MVNEYTPKADDFRQVWAAFNGYGGLVARPHSVSMDEGYAEFDRWLDGVRAEARREGQSEAWDEAVASAYLHEDKYRISIEHDPNPYLEDRHVDQ